MGLLQNQNLTSIKKISSDLYTDITILKKVTKIKPVISRIGVETLY